MCNHPNLKFLTLPESVTWPVQQQYQFIFQHWNRCFLVASFRVWKRESNALVSLDAGYMQRFNPGYVRGPGSAINSVIFTNRWEFMCIFKLCSVFTPHWLIGHGRWGRARGSTNHSWRQSTNHRAGSSCLGFGQHICTVILWYSKSGCFKMKILMRSSALNFSILHLS